MRRSTILCLPLQSVLPGLSLANLLFAPNTLALSLFSNIRLGYKGQLLDDKRSSLFWLTSGDNEINEVVVLKKIFEL